MNTTEKVKNLMEDIPDLKDNDTRLCSHIWFRELEAMGVDVHKQPITDFLRLYAKSKLTLGPTIKRARAKLQEENPNLRGQKYNIRKGVAQDKWKQKLGYNV
jgi:hypothetical protein